MNISYNRSACRSYGYIMHGAQCAVASRIGAAALTMLCTLGPNALAETPAPPADKAAESQQQSPDTLAETPAPPADKAVPQQSPDLVNTQKIDSVSTDKALPDDSHAKPPFEASVPLRDHPPSFYEKCIDPLIGKRLTVGARMVENKLKETSRPANRDDGLTFLGYVNELEPLDESGVRLVVGYRLCPYLGVEFSHDEVAARTRNYNNGLSDGVIRLSGPLYVVTLGYPIAGRLYPYVGFGYAPWRAEFEHDKWWQLGYSSPESHDAQGALPEARSVTRLIEVEDDSATFFTAGVAYRFHRHAQVDVMMRQIDLTSKARFYHDFAGVRILEREGEFTMKHSTYGIALSLVF